MAEIHLVDPVRNLTLNLDGQRIQVREGRLDYYGAKVAIRPKDPTREPIILEVAPTDQTKRQFGRQNSLRVIGYNADAPFDALAGTLTWTQVCGCNAQALKTELLGLPQVTV